MPTQKTKAIRLRGKKVEYKNIPQLAKKLKITKPEAKKLVSDYQSGEIIRYVKKDDNVIKIDLIDKPLLLRKFDVKGISTNKLISGSTVKRGGDKITISSKLTGNVKVRIKGIADVIWSDLSTTSGITLTNGVSTDKPFNFTTNKPSNFTFNTSSVSDLVHMEHFVDAISVKVKSYSISDFNDKKLDISNMLMRDATPPNIDNLFNEVIYNNGWTKCVFDYMKDKLGKRYSVKNFKDIHTVNDIYDFCSAKKIQMIAYDIMGNVIKSFKCKARYGALNFICYNNHLYPLKNKFLKKNKVVNPKFEIIEDAREELIKHLENGIIPADININKRDIYSFVVNGVKYIQNPDYHKCYEILKKFGIEDKIKETTNLNNVCNIIEKLYIKDSINSVFPQGERFIQGGFIYNNDDGKEHKDLITMDLNKAYSTALSKLDFLIKCDITDDKITIGDMEEIHEEYLYIIEPKESSILMDNCNMVSGNHLIYCAKKGLKFEILECITAKRVDNYLKQMVLDLYDKLDNDTFKHIINIYIGKMDRTNIMKTYHKVIKIGNKDETDCTEGYIEKLNDDYNIITNDIERVDIYNRKPINIQIKEKCRQLIYEHMERLNLKPYEIIQVKTDSVSFINTDDEYKKYINNDLGGWKLEKYNKINQREIYKNTGLSFILDSGKGYLCNTYAGAGKSHIIKNKIVSKLDNYRILTPSHSSLKDYVKAGNNCNVIQKNTYFNIIPNENTIIIDEVGFISRKAIHLLIKAHYEGKRIIGLGDFKQLLGFNESNELTGEWINLVFGINDKIYSNWRNNFSIEYYDSLINGDKSYIKKEVRKWSNKESNNIICYRNDTVDKYNKRICEKLGITSMFDIGAKIICKTNKLRDKCIFNNFEFTVKSVAGDNVILDDDTVLTKDDITDNFKYAYARTLHSFQGSSCKDYYFPVEDEYLLNSRFGYTLISRLEQELTEETKARNSKCVSRIDDYLN